MPVFRLLACPKNRDFNYTKANQMGYNWMNGFFSGHNSFNPNAFVWNGNGNRTWEEMTDYLFENKKNFGQSFTFWMGDGIKQLRQHMWPYSTCVELDNYPSAFGTSSGKDVLRLSSLHTE